MAFTLEYILGDERESYENLISKLPPGQNQLKTGIIVPTQGNRQPLSFSLGGCTTGILHYARIANEGKYPGKGEFFFVPTSDTYILTLSLNTGVNTIWIKNSIGTESQFYVSVVNYANLFRASSHEITEYSRYPLNVISSEITSPFGYRLATPILGNLPSLMPSDLETLNILSNKLLIKNFLYGVGLDAGTREILSAFCANTPFFYKMTNYGGMDYPLYRSEELVSGYEAHVWLPNREIERWRAFITFITNLSQLYTIAELNEQIVVIKQGSKLKEHYFDFDSAFANSVIEGASADECFLRLFTLGITIEGYHWIDFCQATYFLDSKIPPFSLNTTEVDSSGLPSFSDFTLTSRFSQQFDISPETHEWYYDSPLIGVVDGVNRYYALTHDPVTSKAVKFLVDGLIQRQGIEYQMSMGSDLRSGIYKLRYASDPLYEVIDTGTSRPFLGPFLGALQNLGSADLQALLTGGPQTLDSLSYLISNPQPITGTQELALHFASPALPSNPPLNQWNQDPLPLGATTYTLTFPVPSTSIDYQLLCFLSEEPLPGGGPTAGEQITHNVRNHTLSGAIIEFSSPIPTTNFKLNWWLIGELTNATGVERGTLDLNDGDLEANLTFSGGPYFDSMVIIGQPWHPTAIGDVGEFLYSTSTLTPYGVKFRFSHPVPGSNWKFDYVVFESQVGNKIDVIYDPPQPGQLVEAHYDTKWPWWYQGPLTPVLADGLLTEFALPYECPNPQAICLSLNGRMLTQPEQYTASKNKVTFKFAPTVNQYPWVIYPLAHPTTGEYPSDWVQGFLTRFPEYRGAYGTGYIQTSNAIPQDEGVQIDGIIIRGVETAEGFIFFPSKIRIGDAVTFPGLGLQLLAAGTSGSGSFAANVSQDDDGLSLAQAINDDPILGPIYYASYQGTGRVRVKARGLMGGAANQVIAVIGTSMTSTNISGDSIGTSVTFPCNVEQGLDLESMRVCLEGNLYLGAHWSFTNDSDRIIITAKLVGLAWNIGITPISPSFTISSSDVQGGKNKINGEDIPFKTPGLLYKDQAPYIGLDGVGTNLWDQYGGNDVKFTYLPALVQEPYILTEKFPIDDHPLDSMEANQPSCTYPKGVFTQMLFSQKETNSVDTSPSSELVITTDGIPIQEAPTFVSPGQYRLTTTSCAGQDSLLLWIDGVYQPPATYGYSVVGTQGEITLTIPLAASQSLWAFYLAASTSLVFPPSAVDVTLDIITVGSHTLIAGQAITFETTDVLPSPLTDSAVYYVLNPTATTIQVATTSSSGSAIDLLDQGVGVHRVSYNQCADEYTVVMTATSDPQVWGIPTGTPLSEAQAFLLFLEGLYNLQGTDYSVLPSLDSIQYAGALAPTGSQSVVGHFNQGVSMSWRQTYVGVGTGSSSSYVIPHTLTSEKPMAASSTLVFMDGLCQRNGVATLSFAPGNVDVGTSTITVVSHGLGDGTGVYVGTSGTLPSGLSQYTLYYTFQTTASSFQLSTNPSGGPAVTLTDGGTGTHYVVQANRTSYIVEIGIDGYPTGTIHFVTPPEPGRIIETAYIKRS